MNEADTMRVAVVVATLGRKHDVANLLHMLARQTLPPSCIVLSVETENDLPPAVLEQPPAGVQIVMGPRGLTMQRNRGLGLVEAASDLVVFYDDDYLPAANALAAIADVFTAHPNLAAATGRVLADGVRTGGISFADAFAILQAYEARPNPPHHKLVPLEGVYGCNMAFRSAAIQGRRFDENLAAYGWQEDFDFAGQLSVAGQVARCDDFAGVHRGATGSRSRGVPLGFSQIINPIYLARKGTMKPRTALRLMARNFLANHLKICHPEPHIDRLGRARGNWIGIGSLLRGRIDPRDINLPGIGQ